VTQRRCAPPWQAMSRSDPDHDAIRTLSLHLRLGGHAGHKRTSFPFIEGFLRKLAKCMRTQAPAWAAHGIGPIPSSFCASGFDLDQGTGECVALYGNCWPPSFTRFASAAVSGLPQKACASGSGWVIPRRIFLHRSWTISCDAPHRCRQPGVDIVRLFRKTLG
jgi:hypothetical protein